MIELGFSHRLLPRDEPAIHPVGKVFAVTIASVCRHETNHPASGGEWHVKAPRLFDDAHHRAFGGQLAVNEPVDSLAFSSNSKQVAAGTSYGSIRLWEAEKGRDLRTIEGHKGPVNSVAFAPDGNMLASASADASVRLWQAPPLSAVLREPANVANAPTPIETLRLFSLAVLFKLRATLSPEGNVHRVEILESHDADWHASVGQVFDDLQEGATYTVRFRARADVPRSVPLGAAIDEPDWHGVGLQEVVSITKDWQTYQYEFKAQRLAASNRVGFALGDRKGTVWIADFTVTRAAK